MTTFMVRHWTGKDFTEPPFEGCFEHPDGWAVHEPELLAALPKLCRRYDVMVPRPGCPHPQAEAGRAPLW